MPEVSPKFLEGVVQFIKAAGEALNETAEAEDAVVQKAADVADTLVQTGLVEGVRKEAAAQNLTDPLKALDSLAEVAKKVTVAPIGSVEKEAEDKSGKQSVRPSDQLFLERFGLAR